MVFDIKKECKNEFDDKDHNKISKLLVIDASR